MCIVAIKNNQFPKVSICVVTYNQEKYIAECLQSIVDQETDFEFEVIVSDDCSSDGTCDIIREFSAKYSCIVPILRKKNIGAFENFVDTHNMAIGEYVCHLDGDDYWLPLKLQKQADYLDKNSECNVVWHRVNMINDHGVFFDGQCYNNTMFPDGIVTFSKALRLGTVASHSSIMYRKKSRKTTNPQYLTLDLFYSWEYLSSGYGIILDGVFGVYRVGSDASISKLRYTLIRKLNAHHAEHFFKAYQHHRKDVFVFALTNFFADLINARSSAFDFFLLALKTFSIISPYGFYRHLREVSSRRLPSCFSRKLK